MTVLPVIGRELRAAARLPFSYYLRVLGVVALLVALVFPEARENLGAGNGGKLFGYFHCALFVAIWFLVPLLAADAISRERREGTLALLFLTPLKPRGIVYAKGIAHALRAVTLWLAVLPVLTICFVVGGIGWPEVVLSVLVNLSSICLALAAGLAASALTRVWARAVGLAMAFAFVFFLAFLSSLPAVILGTLQAIGVLVPDWQGWWGLSTAGGFALAVNADNFWQGLQAELKIGPLPLVWAFVVVAFLTLFLALLMGRLAAWTVGRTWREQPPPARVVWLRDKLCQPVAFQHLLRRWLRWELARNPIGWLEQRSWSGRLVIWS
jgi:ABC-type transport system involved in multi-copper enzyme maturation permease subunit